MASSHRALFDPEAGLAPSTFHTAVKAEEDAATGGEEEGSSHINWVPSLVRLTESPVLNAVGRISRALRRDAWLNRWTETWQSRRKREQKNTAASSTTTHMGPRTIRGRVPRTDKSTINATYVAVHEAHGHGWTVLLKHYPMDVLLVLSFYRSMLLRWDTYEGMLMLEPQKAELFRMMPLGGLGDIRSCFSQYCFSSSIWLELASGCATQGQVDLLASILTHPSYPRDVLGELHTALLAPAFHGNHPTTVKFLMKQFGEARTTTVLGPLLPQMKTPEMLRVVLSIPSNPDEAKQKHIDELVVMCVKQGWVSLAQSLVAIGAEVPTGEVLDRAFRDAIEAGSVETLKCCLWLVSRDSTRTSQQRVALATDGLRYLFTSPECFPKSDCMGTESMAITKILIEAGADARKFRAADGGTLLHWIGADVDMAKVLLASLSPNLAFLNAVDDLGRTALHVAVHQDHTKVIELLLNTRGVKVDVLDSEGRAPQSYARSTDAQCALKVWRDEQVRWMGIKFCPPQRPRQPSI